MVLAFNVMQYIAIGVVTIVGLLSSILIIDELFCIASEGSRIKKRIFWRIRYCDAISIMLGVALMLAYFLT